LGFVTRRLRFIDHMVRSKDVLAQALLDACQVRSHPLETSDLYAVIPGMP
jgi:hypothetical protein